MSFTQPYYQSYLLLWSSKLVSNTKIEYLALVLKNRYMESDVMKIPIQTKYIILGWLAILWISQPPIAYAQQASVKASYAQTFSSDATWARNLIKNSNIVETTLSRLQQELKLKTPLTVQLGGTDGPYFDGQETIYFPYKFITEIRDIFDEAKYAQTIEDRDRFILDVFEHTLWHEIGHYLVMSLKFPITGKEEDAVDEMAYILLINMHDEGTEIALSAADSYEIISMDAKDMIEEDFMGEHSLDQQRFHSGICLIYGSDQDKYQSLVDDLKLSENRQRLCIEDYKRRYNAWSFFFSMHKQDGATFLQDTFD